MTRPLPNVMLLGSPFQNVAVTQLLTSGDFKFQNPDQTLLPAILPISRKHDFRQAPRRNPVLRIAPEIQVLPFELRESIAKVDYVDFRIPSAARLRLPRNAQRIWPNY
jgi:hypothetical protein